MTTNITYSENIELLKLQRELEANGYRKICDCYWFQTFINGEGNIIELERERKKPP